MTTIREPRVFIWRRHDTFMTIKRNFSWESPSFSESKNTWKQKRKRSQRHRFNLLRQWESWEVACYESLLAQTGFLPPMVWGFGVCMFRCKWEWEKWCFYLLKPMFLFAKYLTNQIPRWIKKIWYSSSPSSSTKKSGRLLYCSETVFLSKIFPKLEGNGHFALYIRESMGFSNAKMWSAFGIWA